MRQYLDLLKKIMEEGVDKDDHPSPRLRVV